MPEYLSPGVYTEEIEIGGKPIEGVSTSTAGFLGETERGPTEPRLITGFTQYERLYGDYQWMTGMVASDADKTAAQAAKQAADQTAATAATNLATATRKSRQAAATAAAAGATAADQTAATEAKAALDRAAADKDTADRAAAAATAHAEALAKGPQPSNSYLPYAVAGFFANGGQRCFVGRITGKSADRASASLAGEKGSFTVTAIGPGTWGNRIRVAIQKASTLKQTETLKDGFKLMVLYWPGTPSDATTVGDPPDLKALKDKVNGDAPLHEEFDDLSWNPGDANYILAQLHKQSHLIEVTEAPKAPAPPAPTAAGALLALTNGTDGATVTAADYDGDSKDDNATGLAGLETKEDISIVCIPNQADTGMHDALNTALVGHCERLKDRFAILQAKMEEGDAGGLYPGGGKVDSKYAAFYYPWIKIYDPATSMPKLIPPGGHIAGIYARSDIERGVHKAPANEKVTGAVDVQFSITKGEQDVLNPRGVNCIRSFLGRGILVWGARTTSDDPLWKYVNVRRLFIFLEKSIQRSTQWVVFEPNNEALWARLKQGVSDWLTGVWRDGALMGTAPEQAFFVKCDRTTMTENDIETGKLVMIIGVAPTRPAEFVIFRLAQWRSGSAVSE